MAGTIKLFQIVQHLYRTMGIFTSKPTDICSINSRKLFYLMSMLIVDISRFGYFLFDTTFAQDYGESFYLLISQVITLIDFLIAIWKMPTILHLIKMFEKFIERSKQTKLKMNSLVWIWITLFFSFRIATQIHRKNSVQCHLWWFDCKNRTDDEIYLQYNLKSVHASVSTLIPVYNFEQFFRSWFGQWFL